MVEQMLSKAQVYSFVPDKKTAWQAISRNGYYAPSLKCPLMSIKFMRGVMFQTEFWLPHQTEIFVHCCVDPPSNKEIAKEVHDILIKAVNELNWPD